MKKLLVFNSIGFQESILMAGFDAAGIDYLAISLNSQIMPTDKVMDLPTIAAKIKHPKKPQPMFFSKYKLASRYEVQSVFSSGSIRFLNKEEGKLNYYEDMHRVISSVVYNGQDNRRALEEVYSKDGVHISDIFFNKEGVRAFEFFLGEEELSIEYSDTGWPITVNYKGQKIPYREFNAIIIKEILKTGDFDQLVYNHFGAPLSIAIDVDSIKSVAIYDEDGNDIPGNLLSLMEGEFSTDKVVFTGPAKKWANDSRLKTAKVDTYVINIPAKIKTEGKNNKQAFVYTGTDNLTNIENLIKDNPNIEFNLTAPTAVSEKINGLMKYDNVLVYPNIGFEDLDRLISTAGIFLDINNGREVDNILYRVVTNGAVILSDNDQTRELQSIQKPTNEILQEIASSKAKFEEIRTKVNQEIGIGDAKDFNKIFK